ncbi:MAG: hypothetical protein ACK4UN_04825 [Limisphaerales bacterium]
MKIADSPFQILKCIEIPSGSAILLGLHGGSVIEKMAKTFFRCRLSNETKASTARGSLESKQSNQAKPGTTSFQNPQVHLTTPIVPPDGARWSTAKSLIQIQKHEASAPSP